MRFTLLFILLLILVIQTTANLNCDILSSCPAGSTALLYLKNDSGGLDNAHAELPSSGTYPNILCCNSTEPITNNCGVTFLELSDTTNAHAQDPAYSTEDYTQDACISATTNISCTVSLTGCSGTQTCLVSIASDGNSNQTNAHAGSCGEYDTDVCCSLNSMPGDVTLYDPSNGNITLLNITPTFTWHNTTDIDSSILTYDLQVDEVSSEFQSPVVDITGIAEGTNLTQYTISTALTLDTNYTWRVRAYDGTDYGNWSYNWTFQVASTVILTLMDSSADFGSMTLGETNDTLDNDPYPIRIRNDGNVVADINITADQYLWLMYQTPSSYFQYQINNATADASKGYIDESGSFNFSDSSTWSWYNIAITNTTASIRQLNFTDSQNEAEVDLRIEVPADEPSGSKGAAIVLTGVISS